MRVEAGVELRRVRALVARQRAQRDADASTARRLEQRGDAAGAECHRALAHLGRHRGAVPACKRVAPLVLSKAEEERGEEHAMCLRLFRLINAAYAVEKGDDGLAFKAAGQERLGEPEEVVRWLAAARAAPHASAFFVARGAVQCIAAETTAACADTVAAADDDTMSPGRLSWPVLSDSASAPRKARGDASSNKRPCTCNSSTAKRPCPANAPTGPAGAAEDQYAADDDEICGCVRVVLRDNSNDDGMCRGATERGEQGAGGRTADFGPIAVAPARQGRGIGKALVRAAEEWARTRAGCDRMRIEVVHHRTDLWRAAAAPTAGEEGGAGSASGFYARLGYELVGTAPCDTAHNCGGGQLTRPSHFLVLEKLLPLPQPR